MPERARKGADAEDLAAAYLRLRGCLIVGRNVRAGGGEIDLVARRGEWLLLIEVRFREGIDYGQPIETVRGRKARALARAAHAYIGRFRGTATCWRFDVVTVTLGPDGGACVRHYPGAVPLGE